MRHIILTLTLAALTGCATIGPVHEKTAREIEKGIWGLEKAYMAVVDDYEADSIAYIEEAMQFIHGPGIIKHMVKVSNFEKNICEIQGERDQAAELLEFVLDASAQIENRKKRELAPVKKNMRKLRKNGRNAFGSLRRGAQSLANGLGAYVKDKEWKKEMLRSINVPVDQIDAANRAAAALDKKTRKRAEDLKDKIIETKEGK